MSIHPAQEILDTLAAQYVDCLQVNLAVVADFYHGKGTHLRLGCENPFKPAWQTSLPTIDPGLDGRLAEASGLLGLHIEPAPSGLAHSEIIFIADDAYSLPWTPYYKREHTEHSYLLWPHEGNTWIADGYHIDTPHGIARPTILPAPPGWPDYRPHRTAAVSVRPGTLGPIAVATDPITPSLIANYLSAYASFPDRVTALDALTRETWLLARSRQLHAAYIATEESWRLARQFSALAREVYVAMRCVERDRAEPDGWKLRLFDALCAEPSWRTYRRGGPHD